MRPRRSRLALAALAVLVAALGLGSRRFATFLPHVVATYAGDTLWAVEAYLGILDEHLSESQVGVIRDNMERIATRGGQAPEATTAGITL